VWGEPHGAALTTFAMITVPANTLITPITDRMPAIIEARDWAKWLGEAPATFDELKAMLKPVEGDWTMRLQNAQPVRPKQKPEEPTLF
jgi:putative SOS response-associated peptidase YedK